MPQTLTASERHPSALRNLRPSAARLLLPTLVLQLVLPLAARADAPRTTADEAAADAAGTETRSLNPGGPNSNRQRLSPGGPNSNRKRLNPGGPNSNRQRLSPGGPNSNRKRLNPGGPNSNRQRLNPGGPNSNRQRLNPGGPNSNRQRLGDERPGDGGADRRDPAAQAPRARSFEWTAPNGFVAHVTTQASPHGGTAASAILRSPEGEELTVDFLPASDQGPAALIDGTILVSYTVTDDGRVSQVLVDDGFRAVKSHRHRKPSRADNAAYELLLEAIGERHSPQFLASSARALQALEREGVAPATWRFLLECSLGIVGYTASIAGLITGCTAAGAVTFGGSCALALFAHEVAVASGVLACME